MSRNISQIYDFMSYIIRKQRGVFLTIEQAMDALDNGQLDCFEDWYKMYGVTNEVHDAISKFKITGWFSSNSTGYVTLPSDCLHLATLYCVQGSTIIPVKWFTEDEVGAALNSQLRPVSTNRPLARDDSGNVQLYPQVSQYGTIIYFRRPAVPVYDYTQVGRVITYNASGSTQLEWLDSYINNIIARALSFVSVNMDEDGVMKFAEMYKQETL